MERKSFIGASYYFFWPALLSDKPRPPNLNRTPTPPDDLVAGVNSKNERYRYRVSGHIGH